MVKRSRLSRKRESRLSVCSRLSKITLVEHEGVISDTLTVKINGELMSLRNNPESWKWLKLNLDHGAKVMVERSLWDGTVQCFDWKGSPSYIYRFGATG
jgi:hypothetical protein